MKKLLLLMLISVVVFSCKKDQQQDLPVATQQDVSFTATLVDPGALKGTSDWECKNLEPDYAQITIDGVDYFPLVYRIDGILYTQNIKLDVKTYTVSKFLLWDDGNTPGGVLTEDDDEIVMGIPTSTSDYKVYVDSTVNFVIEVLAFQKLEIAIEVLCFQDDEYEAFGFDWFVITEIVIREQCFFGDICIKHLADYDNSDYKNQINGIQLDMPAMFKIHAFKVVVNDTTEVPFSPFTNRLPYYDPPTNSIPWWGEGNPLCVQYPDNLNVTGEEFLFELWIYVRIGSSWDYKLFHTWKFFDAATIPDGADGIVEFVLGECNYLSTDLQLAPYQNLPTTANITLSHPADPGYWGLFVNSVAPAGVYDLPVGIALEGWCGDSGTTIGQGASNFTVYTSLYSYNWPAGMPSMQKIAEVNWLFNHLADYGMDIMALSNAEGDVIQNAVWNIIHGAGHGGTAANMETDAATYGVNYLPLPGGWAAVLLAKNDNPVTYQLIFTVVDP